MQRQSHGNEQKLVNEKIITSQFLTKDSLNEQENASSKVSQRPPNTKPNRTGIHPELKRTEVLSSVPVQYCDDLITLRPFRLYKKHARKDNEESSIITINISGDRFQTHLSTLQFYPDTLLGNADKRKPYWNAEQKEYFFDRHRACFEAILYYYQSLGRIRRPEFVPIDTFLEEITFFELGSEASTQVHKAENVTEMKRREMPRMLWRRYIWFYFEFPQYSVTARVINIISILFTIISCVSLAIETLPQYNDYWDDICKAEANISLNSTYVPRCPALFQSPFFIIQTICVAYFTVEFFLRFISTPSYYRFTLSFFNWVDLGAIVPYYVFLGIQLATQDIGINTIATLSVRILRVLRFSRIFKIYTIFKQLKSLRVLSATIKESIGDFVVMIVILALLAFLFGAAAFLAEQATNGDVFDSIPSATYWGIITITGVGYGDMYPVTTTGRIIACLCALSGPATMGMLVSVLVDRYQRVYNRKMYLTEPELSSIDLETVGHHDDDTNSVFSLPRSARRGRLSAVLSRRASSYVENIKHDQRLSSVSTTEPYKLQFIVSFNDNNDENYTATDHVVTEMKKKLTEAISSTDIDVNLKLIDENKNELWEISSSYPSVSSTSNLTQSTNVADHPPPITSHSF